MGLVAMTSLSSRTVLEGNTNTRNDRLWATSLIVNRMASSSAWNSLDDAMAERAQRQVRKVQRVMCPVCWGEHFRVGLSMFESRNKCRQQCDFGSRTSTPFSLPSALVFAVSGSLLLIRLPFHIL